MNQENETIESALIKAREFIFIVDYNWWPNILQRSVNRFPFGDVLKEKARTGVEVKILIFMPVPLPQVDFEFDVIVARDKAIREHFQGSGVETI